MSAHSVPSAHRRTGDHLKSAQAALRTWREKLLTEHYSPSPFTARCLLPDSTLKTLASNLDIRTIEDLKTTPTSSTWIYAERHGQDVLDLLVQVDQSHKEERDREAERRRDKRKKAATERQQAEKQRKEQERQEKKARKAAERVEQENIQSLEREALRRQKEMEKWQKTAKAEQERQYRQMAKELAKAPTQHTTHVLANASTWNSYSVSCFETISSSWLIFSFSSSL